MFDQRYSEFLQVFEQSQRGRKCMHPDASPSSCSPGIIQAHSVPVASLKAIANDGHILGIARHPVAWETDEGKPVPRLIGLTRASTFSGFCSRHDDLLFAPIEKGSFEPCEKHAFLLLYRATAKELFAKSAQAEASTNLASRGLNRIEMESQGSGSMIEFDDLYAQVGQRESTDYKNKLDEIFRRKDFGQTRFLVITLEASPEVMCSGLTTPTFDFDGKRIQDYSDLTTPLNSISLTLFRSSENGFAVFTWLVDDDVFAVKLLESLLDRGTSMAISNGIVRFVFGNFENFYVSPRWWTAIGSEKQAELIGLFHVAADLLDDRDAEFWTPGCGESVDWRIACFDSNCDLYGLKLKQPPKNDA